jgi:UPF0176 protein
MTVSQQSTGPIVVAALYKFVTLLDYERLRGQLQETMKTNGVKGSLLLAEEGINGTVSGTRDSIDALFEWFKKDPRLAGSNHEFDFLTFCRY